MPEAHWDATANGINLDTLGQHYGELSTFHKTQTEAQAALKARKPEDIKLQIKLPETVKVPDGMKVEIDDKDPRLPVVRELAIKHGWDQDTIDAIATLDAQFKIEQHNAEVERVKAEDTKLGEKGGERKSAVSAWAKGLLDRKEISDGEYEELKLTATTAAGVTVLEKIIAKSNGAVPGAAGSPPAPPAPPTTVEQRWYAQKG